MRHAPSHADHLVIVVTLIVLATLITPTFSAAEATAPGAPEKRQARFVEIPASASIPEDLASPEGRSRWDLSALDRRDLVTRTIEEGAGGVTLTDERSTPAGPRTTSAVYSDPYGGDAALRWLYPDRYRDSLRPGTRETIEIDEARDGGGADRLRIDTEITGIGWLHLASGPREVVLQRALVEREAAGRRGFDEEALIHRFIDPLAGVVAEIEGSPDASGRGRARIGRAIALDATISSAATLKIHVSENSDPVLTTLFYGWDRGSGTAVSSIDPNAYATIGDLVAQSTWNFSVNTSGTEVGSITTPINSAETCDFAQCGYTQPAGVLERSDKAFNDPNNLYKVNDVAETEVRANDVTVWLRAGSQNEGKSGSFGSGESRFCYITSGGKTRTPVPLWQFTHKDSPTTEYYYQTGDHWEGGPFMCEQDTWNQVCGVSGTLDTFYIQACNTHTGKQFSDVLKGGVVTTPSGHTFNTLLVRSVADFCVYIGSACGSLGKVSEVRTVNYLWQAPHLGTVARVQSVQNAADYTSFTTLAETNFQFGLFPPRSINVTGTGTSSVSLSWDPGLDTHRISGYKVYWDTDSGSSSPYAFNSVANAGQASIAGTTATISGLTPGATYYFTVTSLSSYRDPSSGVTTSYESLLYPTQISGDPSFIYPVEVQGVPCSSCVPASEVTGVTATRVSGTLQLCWNAVSDPVANGYRILGSNSKQSAAGYSTVADVGLQTCWSGAPSQTYFIVAARGPGGVGPWGHYGQ